MKICLGDLMQDHMVNCCNNVAQWSRGMIRASGARGPGFKSRMSPLLSSSSINGDCEREFFSRATEIPIE